MNRMLYLQRDHAADWSRWEHQVAHIAESLRDLPGVRTGPVPHEIISHVPRVFVEWDEAARRLSIQDVVERLRGGEPRIEVLVTTCGLTISPNTLEPGEERIVARRLRQVLGS